MLAWLETRCPHEREASRDKVRLTAIRTIGMVAQRGAGEMLVLCVFYPRLAPRASINLTIPSL